MKKDKYQYRHEFATDHRRYLERLFDNEEQRLQAIESKVHSIIGQTGLIMSLLGLTLPTLIDSVNKKGSGLTILVVVLYVCALACFIWSILEAIQVLNIKKFKYMSGSTSTVLTKHNNLDEFMEEEIADLILSIENNIKLNNTKGTHLLKARRNLRNGLILVGFFGIVVAYTFVPTCF